MFVRAVLAGAILVVSGPDVPGPSADTTVKYRLATEIEQIVDLSSVGQAEQRSTVTQSIDLTIRLSDSAGGQAVHVVIDSIHATGLGTPPQAVMDSARGAWIHGFRTSGAQPSNLTTSNDSSDVIAQIKTALQTFYPRVKDGFQPGDKWTDTTQVNAKSSSQAVVSTVVTAYTVGEQETYGGTPALRLDAVVTSVGSGTVENPAMGSMDFEAEETGSRVFFVTAEGVYLGGTTTAVGQASVSAAMLQTPIPITINRKNTVTVRR